ncbi:hypothetical protein [Xanthomonas fragariae]|uniref:hypothetical protein n=1 Tax=Xanthomonas fragariae TaxID=48664 RepID=UPI0022AA215D|nr:hypothetical protein [Xanthomonas fragariae]WAT14797.1 hypothetical protein OZ429_17970 [Xanthomonas fragariae]
MSDSTGIAGAQARYGDRVRVSRAASMIAAGQFSSGTEMAPVHGDRLIVGSRRAREAIAFCRIGFQEAHLSGDRTRH